MIKVLRSHKLYVPLITIAGSVGLFLVYYLFYVSWQRNYANDRAFRLLAVAGDQLINRYQNLRNIFAAAAHVSPGSAQYLESVLKDEISDIEAGRPCPVSLSREGELKLALIDKPGSFALRATFHPSECNVCLLSGTVDLSADINERFSNATEEYFDDILIATSSGEVLSQKRVSGLRITNLNAVLNGTSPARKPLKEENGPKKMSAFEEASQYSNLLDVRLAGDDYKLYIQPVDIAIAGPAGRNLKPIVCGLWRSERLQSEVVSIPYSTLIWGTLVVLPIFVMAWPLLKVAYMSPAERLRRKHVFYLLLSSLTAATMLTLIVLNLSYTLIGNEESREQLEAFADRIECQVQKELARSLAFMDRLGQDEHVRSEFRKAEKWAPGVNFLQSNFTKRGSPGYYPYFDSAFWVDRDGQQLYKLTTQAMATPRTSIRKDPYFQDLRDEMRLTAGTKRTGPPIFRFDSVYSPNTGEFFVVVARPAPDVAAYLKNANAQILVTRFLSLLDPVVPAGFGFAVVNRDGVVQFHSAAARNHIEDFFMECRQNPMLKSLVLNGSGDYLQVNYLGKRQDMLVRPMPYLADHGPSLIVFRDTNYFTTINVACLLVFALLAVLFSVPFGTGLAVYVFKRGDYPLIGLWPCAWKTPKYVDGIVANVCLAIAFAMRFQWLTMDETLVRVLVMDVAAVFFATLKATGKTRTLLGKPLMLAAIVIVAGWSLALVAAAIYIALSVPRASERLSALAERFKVKHVYLAMVLSVLTVIVVLPSFGLFKISYNTVNRLALQAAQVARRDQLAARAGQVKRHFLALNATGYVHDRLGEELDRYDKAVFYPKQGEPQPGAESPDVSSLEICIAKLSGLFPSNRLGTELREMATTFRSGRGPRAGGMEWKSMRDDDDQLLWLPVARGDIPEAALVGVYPLWKLPWLAALVMAGLAALLTAWLYFIIRKVFMTDLEEVPPLENWLPDAQPRRNVMILGHPKSGKASRAASLPATDMLDLVKVVTTGHWGLEDLHQPTVALEHFEFDIDNPDTCLAKLKFLEQLLYVAKKRVILLSAVDPMFYLANSSPEIVTPTGTGQEPPAQLLDRWAAVLSLFEKRKMKDITEDYFSRMLTDPDPCRKELVEMIQQECDYTAQLRRIGIDMLKAHCHEEPMSKARFVEELLDRADSYYRVLWSTCTKQERLVLFQLARDGWANPKNDWAIQQLQRRGIIRKTSGFQIMNESFCRFIRTAQSPEEVARWEEEEDHSAWSAVKLGLSTALMMLGAWLLYTQQDAFQMGLGYVSTLGTATAAVISLTRNLRGRGSTPSSG